MDDGLVPFISRNRQVLPGASLHDDALDTVPEITDVIVTERAGAENEFVVARTACQIVIPRAAVQIVMTGAAVEPVIPRVATQAIIPHAAIKRVVARATKKRIIPAVTNKPESPIAGGRGHCGTIGDQ